MLQADRGAGCTVSCAPACNDGPVQGQSFEGAMHKSAVMFVFSNSRELQLGSLTPSCLCASFHFWLQAASGNPGSWWSLFLYVLACGCSHFEPSCFYESLFSTFGRFAHPRGFGCCFFLSTSHLDIETHATNQCIHTVDERNPFHARTDWKPLQEIRIVPWLFRWCGIGPSTIGVRFGGRQSDES